MGKSFRGNCIEFFKVSVSFVDINSSGTRLHCMSRIASCSKSVESEFEFMANELKEKILFVDDEETILNVASEFFQRRGDEIWLDEENNVHVKCILTTEEMMSGDTKTITLYEGNNIQIPCSELYCRSYQTYRIYKQGIPQIHETNIFDTTQRSDIVVHVFHKK